MNISMVRGTSQTFNITLLDPQKQAYFLAAGEVLRFGVKLRPEDRSCLIEKELTAADLKNGVYPVKLTPEDTASLGCYTYYYDAGVQSGEDYWIVLDGYLEITKNITGKKVAADG